MGDVTKKKSAKKPVMPGEHFDFICGSCGGDTFHVSSYGMTCAECGNYMHWRNVMRDTHLMQMIVRGSH